MRKPSLLFALSVASVLPGLVQAQMSPQQLVQDAEQKSNALYGTFRPPESYVIDKNGVIRRKFIGAEDWTSPEIVNFLKKLAS